MNRISTSRWLLWIVGVSLSMGSPLTYAAGRSAPPTVVSQIKKPLADDIADAAINNPSKKPSTILFGAIQFFAAKMAKSNTIWDFIRSSNTLLELIAADSELDADFKEEGILAMSTADSWKSQKNDVATATEFLDALLLPASLEEINKLAYFIVKEAEIKSTLSGQPGLFEDAVKKLDIISPVDPQYLAVASQKYLDENKPSLGDLINSKAALQGSVNGKDDKNKAGGAGPIGQKAEDSIASAKQDSQSPLSKMTACFDAYMGSDGGNGGPPMKSPGGGIGNPLGTTGPDEGFQPYQKKTPGPHGPKTEGMEYASVGGAGVTSESSACYGVDMSKIMSGKIGQGEDHSYRSRQRGFLDGNVYVEYTIQVGKQVDTHKGEDYLSVEISTREFSKGGDGKWKLTLSTEEKTVMTINEINKRDSEYKQEIKALSKEAEDPKYFYDDGNDDIPIYPSEESDVSENVSKAKSPSWDQDVGDSPCDGEKDHQAFAACVGASGGSAGGNAAGAIGADGEALPSCEAQANDFGEPNNPLAATTKSTGGDGSSCPDHAICKKSKQQCVGANYAVEMYAMNPNLPLWDPAEMMAAVQQAAQKSAPQLKSTNQLNKTSQTQQKSASQVKGGSSQMGAAKSSQAGGAIKDAKSGQTSGKVPLKPLGSGGKPGGGTGGSTPAPQPKPGK